jgi:hypothetical protein
MADAQFLSADPETPTDQAQEQAQVDPLNPDTWGGDGYPFAPDDVTGAMRELVATAEMENMLARLGQIREILRNREFYAGRQVSYWSAMENRYRVPTAEELGVTEDEYTAAVELVTNCPKRRRVPHSRRNTQRTWRT